jgi:hypothetical protein
MVQPIAAIMLALLLLPGPVMGGMAACCCDRPAPVSEPVSVTTDRCCASQTACHENEGGDEPTPQDERHEGCGCPLACCSPAKTFATPTPATYLGPASAPVSPAAMVYVSAPSSPHLSGLKRPPRTVTAS